LSTATLSGSTLLSGDELGLIAQLSRIGVPIFGQPPPGKKKVGPVEDGTDSGNLLGGEVHLDSSRPSDVTGSTKNTVRIGVGSVSVRVGRSRLDLSPIDCLALAAELESAAELAERRAA
jgi:hypothetical protein